MRIALVADTFPPHKSSGAVQLRDLSREFVRQGHDLTVLLPSPGQVEPWSIEDVDGFKVLRFRAPRTKDISYLRRTVAELMMPFAMWRQYRKSPLANECWDGVVWYSPSIFHGPFVNALKRVSKCNSYLIIRDIFPEWAVDMGLMKRGVIYWFFNAIASYQYYVADIIGVQTPGNLKYFKKWEIGSKRKLEVLQNWLGKAGNSQCPINLSETNLNGRTIFIYTGNMGVAQGMNIIINLAEALAHCSDIGFLFIGRGSEVPRLKILANERNLNNVLFLDEIHPDQLPNLLAQCGAGVVALDSRHRSHNIPGKFLTYMRGGLPVLANINAGNDLSQIIRKEKVGQVCENNNLNDLIQLTETLLVQIEKGSEELSDRCINLFERDFSVDSVVKQIVSSLTNDDWNKL